MYRFLVAWIILTPLVWPLAGQSDFVALTLIVNAAQVVIIPVIVVGMWIITAKAKYIGPVYRNRLWENVAIGLLFLLGMYQHVVCCNQAPRAGSGAPPLTSSLGVELQHSRCGGLRGGDSLQLHRAEKSGSCGAQPEASNGL